MNFNFNIAEIASDLKCCDSILRLALSRLPCSSLIILCLYICWTRQVDFYLQILSIYWYNYRVELFTTYYNILKSNQRHQIFFSFLISLFMYR